MADARPDGCCGVCPPILGGGYDCTCSGNPRCPSVRAAERERLVLESEIGNRDIQAKEYRAIFAAAYNLDLSAWAFEGDDDTLRDPVSDPQRKVRA